MQLPVKQHRTKTSNRYFNYIYVRMGACTFIHKRTADDIWKNLFELPLVEADRNLSEEEFLSSASFRSLIAEGEVPEVRLVFRNVKHVLSHRVIYANFYEVVLPENSRSFRNTSVSEWKIWSSIRYLAWYMLFGEVFIKVGCILA